MGNTSGASMMYPGRMTAKDRRLLKMILVIFVSFVICYLPITINKTFDSIAQNHFMNITGYLLIYLTTCINPIIYVVMSSEYRQAYKNLLMCRNGNVRQGKNEIQRNASPRAWQMIFTSSKTVTTTTSSATTTSNLTASSSTNKWGLLIILHR